MEKEKVKAVGYLRMSSDQQGEKSISQQLKEVETLAEREGYEVVKWYEEPGVSGKNDEDRPAFQELISDAAEILRWKRAKEKDRKQPPSLQFRAVLCWDTARFSRANALKAAASKDVLADAGIHLHTCSEGKIDWSQAFDRIVDVLRAEGNHEYLVKLAKNTIRGREDALEKGHWPHGPTPYGYLNVLTDHTGREFVYPRDQNVQRPRGWKRHFVINETEAALIQRVFHEFLDQDYPLSKIAKRLREDHVPAPKGGTVWRPAAVRFLLSQKAYAGFGHIRGHWQSKASYPSNPLHTATPNEVEGVFPEIVSLDRWERALAKLERNRAEHRRAPRSEWAFLSGLVVCGHCGRRMVAAVMTGIGYYRCNGRSYEEAGCVRQKVREDVLLPLVVQRLRESLDRKALQLTQVKPSLPEEGRVERLRSKLAKLQEDLRTGSKNLLKAPEILRAGLEEALLELHQDIEKTKADLEAETQTSGQCRETAEQVLAYRDRLVTLAPPVYRTTSQVPTDHLDTPKKNLEWGKALDAALSRDMSGTGMQVYTNEVRDGQLTTTLMETPAVVVSPGEFRGFLKSLNFKVTCYFKELEKRGPHGLKWALDSARLEVALQVGPMDGDPKTTARTAGTRISS